MTTDNLDLAREWAEWVHDNPEIYSGTSDRARAAADLISSLPDEWVDAGKLRETIEFHRDRWPHGAEEDLESLLPAPPAPRTMAEIEWDDAEHHLAEATAAWTEGTTSEVVMLHRYGDKIAVCQPEPTYMGFRELNPAILTPTGRKYRLEPEDDTPTSSAEDKPAPESATPRPEDVPVGEPWQVEAFGKVAIGYRNDPENEVCWAIVYRDDASHGWLNDDYVTLTARLVPETTEEDMQ